jgi:hypothetical protein
MIASITAKMVRGTSYVGGFVLAPHLRVKNTDMKTPRMRTMASKWGFMLY